jgi:hypothetical protein
MLVYNLNKYKQLGEFRIISFPVLFFKYLLALK